MRSVALGATLALTVSVAPGANTVLCLRLARRRVADALPLIATAALTDCCYAALGSLGALRATHLSAAVSAWGSAALLVLAAVLVWPAQKKVRPIGAASVAALNPATAALWVGMSGTAISAQRTSVIHPAALALGALLATAGWFLTLSYLSSRLTGRLFASKRTGRCFSVALLALAATQAAARLSL
jgi:arginine exporter protein ArgO